METHLPNLVGCQVWSSADSYPPKQSHSILIPVPRSPGAAHATTCQPMLEQHVPQGVKNMSLQESQELQILVLAMLPFSHLYIFGY